MQDEVIHIKSVNLISKNITSELYISTFVNYRSMDKLKSKCVKSYIRNVIVVAPGLHVCKANGPQVTSNSHSPRSTAQEELKSCWCWVKVEKLVKYDEACRVEWQCRERGS